MPVHSVPVYTMQTEAMLHGLILIPEDRSHAVDLHLTIPHLSISHPAYQIIHCPVARVDCQLCHSRRSHGQPFQGGLY